MRASKPPKSKKERKVSVTISVEPSVLEGLDEIVQALNERGVEANRSSLLREILNFFRERNGRELVLKSMDYTLDLFKDLNPATASKGA